MTVADASDVTVGSHVGLTAMLKMRDGVAAPDEPEPAPNPTPPLLPPPITVETTQPRPRPRPC